MIRHRLFARLVVWGTALVLLASACFGQEPKPDRRGEVALRTPEYKGTTANAPIPTSLHIRNEGGSDGAGLCVIASLLINGGYQEVPGIAGKPNEKGEAGKASLLWQTAKKRPGGYSPDKLERLLKEVMPDEKWVSFYGKDPAAVMDELSRQGYPMGVTMNTGALYNYAPIAHMVSLAHFRSGELACVVDNNDPGKYHWMPADEMLRRDPSWVFAWSRLPTPVKVAAAVSLVLITAALLLLAASTLMGGYGAYVLTSESK